MKTACFIFYVRDQELAARFYQAALAARPRLHVPGMTEFELPGGAVLGLMPEAGIRRLLGPALPDPSGAAGAPRAELYLVVDEPEAYMRQARSAGARMLSPVLARDWGHEAGYVLDPDGHVLAFARDRGGA